MTELTRRRMKDSKVDVWHVYYGDVQVGTIGMRSGVRNDVDQWGWTCGFNSSGGHSVRRNCQFCLPYYRLARSQRSCLGRARI
jgi:hypothetical protein